MTILQKTSFETKITFLEPSAQDVIQAADLPSTESIAATTCDQLALAISQISTSVTTSVVDTTGQELAVSTLTSSDLPPLPHPQEDPNFDTSIPYYIDAQGHKHIDYKALLERLNKIFNFLRCNIMNLAAAREAFLFLKNLGGVWGQLSADQQKELSKILNQPIKGKDGKNIVIFGQFTVSNLGELIAYTMCLSEFYYNPGTFKSRIEAVQKRIMELMSDLNGLPQDFMSSCDFLKNFKEALIKLQAPDEYGVAWGTLYQWGMKHWSAQLGTLDDHGEAVDFTRWILDAEGYMGKFLLMTDFGNYRKPGSWEKNYFATLLAQMGDCKNPFLLFLYLLSILDQQNEGRQEEIVGAGQPAKYLGYVNEALSKALSILAKKDWNTDGSDTTAFFRALEDAKRLITNDADIPDALKGQILNNLDTIFTHVDDSVKPPKTLEELFKSKKPEDLIRLTFYFNQYVFGGSSKTPTSLDLFTKFSNTLTENVDSCKEQSSTQGTLVTNMGNTLNQFFAIMKSLRDDYIKQGEQAVRNAVVK